MGYTHYWKRENEIPLEKFKDIVNDFKKTMAMITEAGVKLGDGLGINQPIINYYEVIFNGLKNCGHLKNENIIIPWPSYHASGVASYFENKNRISKKWLGGTLLDTRCCNGDCSYETFAFKRIGSNNERYDGLEFCKTAFRPYDLAVITFLIIAKHHLKNEIKVMSDGKNSHWYDGKYICQMVLDYGFEFVLDE